MIKRILIPLFLLIIASMVYEMTAKTIVSSRFFQEKLGRIENDLYLKKSLSYLTHDDVKRMRLQYKNDLAQLGGLKRNMIALLALSGIWLMAILAFKHDFSVKKFDAVYMMIAYMLLLFAIVGVGKIFTGGHFEEGNNATIQSRVVIKVILLIITPLIFFTTYQLNQLEMRRNWHQEKWISNLAIFLMVFSGLLALVIGVGVLMTPDVSSFTS